MKNKVLLCAVSIMLLAMWYPAAGQQRVARKAQCREAVCIVQVDVSGSPPAVTVDIDELQVTRGNRGPGNGGVVMRWHLQNKDYEFKDDSIQFYDPRFQQEFDDKSTAVNRSQFRYRNRNSAPGTWGYLVKVYDRRTGVAITLDPIIQNDG